MVYFFTKYGAILVQRRISCSVTGIGEITCNLHGIDNFFQFQYEWSAYVQESDRGDKCLLSSFFELTVWLSLDVMNGKEFARKYVCSHCLVSMVYYTFGPF